MTRILVVDDSAIDRRLAGGLLERNLDVELLYAEDGKEAISQIEEHLPDLVLTDLQMPEMNGLDLVKAVKEQYPLIPVILMTARGSEDIAVRALQNGAASYVAKQSLSHDLVETVERVITASGEERAQSRLMDQLVRCDYVFELTNELSLVTGLASFLRQTIRGLNLASETDHLRLGIALEEALLNAYYHGNLEVSSKLREVDYTSYYRLANERASQDPYRDRRIRVEASLTPEEFRCVICDDGPGFDPGELPDPTDPMNLERPSGRGILLMRTFMDEVVYNDQGNQVTLVKRHEANGARLEEQSVE